MEADKQAFVALMSHLESIDHRRTVIMMQVQNEVGTYGSVRDYSTTAEALFREEVPRELLRAMDRESGDWRAVFGDDADEYFHAWHIARYCDEIAAAGKAARLGFEGRVWGVSEPPDTDSMADDEWKPEAGERAEKDDASQRIDLGKWTAEVSYGRPMFGNPPPRGNHPVSGGAAIAELGPDEYLVTGLHARVTFFPSGELEGRNMILARVEEEHFHGGRWVFERVWNGDQTDWGLNFSGNPHVLKVRIATYETQ
ncbi:MAG TPA: DUF5597 domain-containing protein [Woeseiaceae bacterium]|nr:DUF5597 domain-containing protein [Woeseiaceae bacterium]